MVLVSTALVLVNANIETIWFSNQVIQIMELDPSTVRARWSKVSPIRVLLFKDARWVSLFLNAGSVDKR